MTSELLYYHTTEWVVQGSIWRPSRHPPTPDIITLYDESGTVLTAGGLTTLVLTLYDPSISTYPIVNSINQFDMKSASTRGSLNSSGVLGLKLLAADTEMTAAHSGETYERRDALIEWTGASNTKTGALLIRFVIRNLVRRPYVAP